MTDPNRARWLAMGAVALLAGFVFLPAVGGAFVWDDLPLIVGNAHLRHPESLWSLLGTPFWHVSGGLDVAPDYAALHRPLVKLAYHLELSAFGDDPAGFHWVSLLLHAACVALVFDLLRLRLGRDGVAGLAAAGAGAALFAVHPSRAESVAWISGSTDLWMTLFVLLAARALHDAKDPKRLWAGGVAIALAGFSKEVGLLAVIPIATDAMLRGEGRAGLVRRAAPLAAGALTVVVVWAVVVGALPSASGEARAPLPLRVLASIGEYVRAVLMPWPSSIRRVIPTLDDGADGASALAIGGLSLLLFLGVAAASRKREDLRPWVADALWFFVPLLPASNFLVGTSGAFASDRFLYLPMFGVAAMVARALLPVVEVEGTKRMVALGAAGLAALGLGRLTMLHGEHFASQEGLWQHELELHPNDPDVYDALLASLHARGAVEQEAELALVAAGHAHEAGDRPMEAQFLLRWLATRVTTISDAEQAELLQIRAVYDGLGESETLRFDGASVHFETSLGAAARRTLMADPDRFGLPQAIAHLRTFDLEGAEERLAAIARGDTPRREAFHLLAIARARQGDFDGAVEALADAEARFPGSPTTLAFRQNVQEAARAARAPVDDPRAAAMRDATVQQMLGSPEAARRILDPLLALTPADHELVMMRAQCDVSDRRFDLARATLEAARVAAPGDEFFDAALASLAQTEAQASQR
ncbi:MAG: hypothetical protein R3B82_02115 [Sandaracinaceae bacterium]